MSSHRTRKAGRHHSKHHSKGKRGGSLAMGGVIKQMSVPLALVAMNQHAKKHRSKKHTGGKRRRGSRKTHKHKRHRSRKGGR